MGALSKLSILTVAACSLAMAQESATVRGPEVAKAGESVDFEISVDSAPNFEGGGLMVWVAGPGFDQQSGCSLPRGEKKCLYRLNLPIDISSGTVYITKIAFWTGSRQIDLPFKKVGFQVVASSGLVFPSRAEVSVRPSQVQLLRGEEMRLEAQVQTLKASVAGEQEPLRAGTIRALRDRLEEELDSLKATESRFRELGDNSQTAAAQVFFDDLRTGYTEVLAGLSEKKRKERSSIRESIVAAAWPPQTEGEQHGGRRYPLTALAVLRPFELNELAYRLVADTSSLTFSLEVNSNPEGATVFYGRRGDTSYKQHQNPTNSTIKSLPYAIWIVRFQKPGFRDKDVEFNPFVEPNRVITAILTK
jgi:hypothetical protein